MLGRVLQRGTPLALDCLHHGKVFFVVADIRTLAVNVKHEFLVFEVSHLEDLFFLFGLGRLVLGCGNGLDSALSPSFLLLNRVLLLINMHDVVLG